MTFAKKVALLACVLPIAFASGCTGTDVLRTGNSAFTIAVEVVNPTSRHDFSLFTISAINVRPNGVEADAALGSAPIGIIATQDDLLNINLNDLSEFSPTTIRLSTGSYRIDRIEMSGLTFVDFQGPMPAPNCQELISYPVVPPVAIFADQLGNPNLSVTAGGGGSVTIQIDGAALVDAFEASFPTCNLNNSSAASNQFRPALFAAAAPTFITLR